MVTSEQLVESSDNVEFWKFCNLSIMKGFAKSIMRKLQISSNYLDISRSLVLIESLFKCHE